jgi:tripartite-type tricarboxylate transporter receptor subunit TctC
VLAPAGTPAAIQDEIASQVAAFVQRDDIRERFAAFGYSPMGSTPAEFRQHLENEAATWDQAAAVADIEKQ